MISAKTRPHSGSSANESNSIETAEVRRRIEMVVINRLSDASNVVLQAPTSAGKSHVVSTTQWRDLPTITGGEPVIHLSDSTDARDSSFNKNESSAASGHRLLGRKDACPMFRGDYDDKMDAPDGSDPSEWLKRMCEGRGLSLSVAHTEFYKRYCGDLTRVPCEGCRQWEGVPRDEDGDPSYDVIFATHQFARAPAVIKNCNVVIDELPDFSTNLTTEDIRQSVRSYLNRVDAPDRTWEDLIVSHGQRKSNLFFIQQFDRPDREWILEGDHGHVLTPGLVRAILAAEPQCHDRWKGECLYRYPDLNPGSDSPTYSVRIRVVFDDNYDIELLQVVPDFSEARCVIGLDAHPTEPKWKANTLQSIDFEQLLSDEEAQYWRRNERNLEIVQVGDNKNSWTNRGFNEHKVTGICAELRHQYGNDFSTGITSDRFEGKLEQCMRSIGIDSPDTTHYGKEKSVDIFDGEKFGLVAGCISPSSEQIKDWLALLEKEATPRREEFDDYEGQDWVGPDADVAKELLRDVREKGVLQAAGRYARSPDDPDDGATVYVLTNVLPSRKVDREVDDVQTFGTKAQEIIATVADSRDGLTPREILSRVDASRRYVYKILDQCRETPWMDVEEGAGSNDPDVFYTDRSPNCIVEL